MAFFTPIVKVAADSSAINSQIKVFGLYWLNPATIGDTCVLQDNAGNVVISLRCEVANQSQLFTVPNPNGEFIPGYKLSTLSSGTAYIYIG